MSDIELQVGVKCFIKNKEGKFLLLKLSDTSPKLPGWWDIPGGRIELDESTEDGLKREIKEEIGFDFQSDLKVIDIQDIFSKSGDRHIVRINYIAEVLEDFEIKLSYEHSDFDWFLREEIEKLDDVDSYIMDSLKYLK